VELELNPNQEQQNLNKEGSSIAMADLNDQEGRTRAPKFNGKDFWTWSFRFQQWATAADLWQFFDGTVDPRPTTAGDSQRRWDRVNQRAFAELCNALEPDELIRIVREFGASRKLAVNADGATSATTVAARPQQAWERLEGFFIQRQLSSRIVIERQLNMLRMEPGETIQSYWARADELRQKFVAAGGVQDSHSWMGKVIAGLPENWETLKVVLNTQFAAMTEASLLTALATEEARQGEQTSASAMAVFAPKRSQGFRAKKEGAERPRQGPSPFKLERS
jgi:hypothetical protein